MHVNDLDSLLGAGRGDDDDESDVGSLLAGTEDRDIGAAENPIIDEPALEAAASGEFKGLSAPVGNVDDLKRISGIAPKLEQRLNDLGVFHFWQVAKLSKEEAASIEKSLSITGRIERDGWIAQARKLQDSD